MNSPVSSFSLSFCVARAASRLGATVRVGTGVLAIRTGACEDAAASSEETLCGLSSWLPPLRTTSRSPAIKATSTAIHHLLFLATISSVIPEPRFFYARGDGRAFSWVSTVPSVPFRNRRNHPRGSLEGANPGRSRLDSPRVRRVLSRLRYAPARQLHVLSKDVQAQLPRVQC